MKHFNRAFDLTSTQEASHDFIHPELTNYSISVDLTFSRALAHNVETLLLGERKATFYITSDLNVKITYNLPRKRIFLKFLHSYKNATI